MKKFFALALSLALALTAFAGCSSTSASTSTPSAASGSTAGSAGTAASGELNLYTWEGMFPQEVLDAFTAETGIKVNYSSFDTDETMLAKLETAKGGDYDVVIADDYIIETAIAEGLVMELDKSKIANIGNVNPVYQGQFFDPEDAYTVPYGAGVQTIVYNPDLVDIEINGYEDLWDAALESSLGITSNFRVMNGMALNVVPETVVMEAMVRAATLEALDDAARKFDRACTHAAEALGAHAEILTYQGYMPVRPAPVDPALLAAAAALPGLSAQCAEPGMQNIASTDVGDLSQVMPVVNFTHGGTAGALHSADFAVTDVDKAYIAPAKMMALTAYHLLKDGAVLARRTMDGFTPVFTRESYIETVRRQG